MLPVNNTINSQTIPHSPIATNSPSEAISITISDSTNPISKGLLYLKKAASYTISFSGLTTKGVALGTIAFINTLITAEHLLSKDDDEENIITRQLSFIPDIALRSLAYTYLALIPLGAKKAGQLIDSLRPDSSQLAIKVAKGAIYTITTAIVAQTSFDIISDSEINFLPEALIQSSALILSTLGAKVCIDFISHSQNKLQAAVKKIQ